MNEIGFNIFAFTRPQNHAEHLALLDEAIRASLEIESLIDDMSSQLRANALKAIACR